MIKMAYIIQAHTGYKQITLLISKLILNERIDAYIHIDAKNPSLKEKLQTNYKDSKNVFVLSTSVNVNWSGFSQVQATLLAFKYIEQSQREYDFISLLSGQDYPLKSPEKILAFLNRNKHKSFIEYEDIGQYAWRLKKYNFLNEHPKTRTLLFKIIRKINIILQRFLQINRRYNHENPYKGSQWFTINNEAFKFILQQVNETNLITKYRYTSCADEHFFQNILLNSSLKKSIINNNLRYIVWKDGESSPKTYNLSGVNLIAKSSVHKDDILWIRKVFINSKQENEL